MCRYAAAVATGERLVTAENVNAIVGAMCSGATQAVLEGVAMPNGIVMISGFSNRSSFINSRR